MKFKVGDKVRVLPDTDWGRMEGFTGVVTLIDDQTPFINVTMDELPEDIAASGCSLENWFMIEEEIELVED